MYGIQGQRLEINVVGGRNLKDTEWLSKQDPYVVVEYGPQKFRTKTDTDGGRNPSFNDKFALSLIEGLREFHVHVWNSNTLSTDDLIGTGRVQLDKVLSTGYDENSWNLSSKSGKHAGELRLIMHFNQAAASQKEHGHKGDKGDKGDKGHAYPPAAFPPGYNPSHSGYNPSHPGAYPPAPAPGHYPPQGNYPPATGGYPPGPAPGGYPSGPAPGGYPPAPMPTGYPPVQGGYPPPPAGYPPHGSSSSYDQKPKHQMPHSAAAHVPSGYPIVAPHQKPDKHGAHGAYGHGTGGGHGHYSHGKHKKYKHGKTKLGWKGFKKAFK